MSDHQAIIFKLYEIGAIQFGEFKLKSGQTSSIYINLRKVISYPDLLRQISEAMWEKIKEQTFNLVCGVPYTALPIATCFSLDHQIPMIMRRKEKKDYGTKQLVEGEFKPGQSCLIIEDVITTGGSIIETAQDLEESGIIINDVIVLVDREQGGKENLSKKFHTHTILKLSDIVVKLLNSELITKEDRIHLRNWSRV